METVWSSAAALAMAPLQDVLNFKREARINVPATPGVTWTWRYDEDVRLQASELVRDLTQATNRSRPHHESDRASSIIWARVSGLIISRAICSTVVRSSTTSTSCQSRDSHRIQRSSTTL